MLGDVLNRDRVSAVAALVRVLRSATLTVVCARRGQQSPTGCDQIVLGHDREVGDDLTARFLPQMILRAVSRGLSYGGWEERPVAPIAREDLGACQISIRPSSISSLI